MSATDITEWRQLGEDDIDLSERYFSDSVDLENLEWRRVNEISTDGRMSLQKIKLYALEGRMFWLKNPLINRGIGVTADYVFGRGITINARDDEINVVVQQFIDDKQNQVELTSHQSMLAKDREQQCDGNTFLLLFVHALTGRVRVRSFSLNEIEKIICNPDDSKQPWYYKRQYVIDNKTITKYYRDWRLQNDFADALPDGAKPEENVYVYHIKTGAFSDWQFGMCEFYSTQSWAKAYNKFLTNWSILMEAYARFAMVIKTEGGSRAVESVKNKIASSFNGVTGTGVDTNPPPATGSTATMDKRLALDVVKTAGATTKAEEGRRLELMVCAGLGLGEHMLGDVSVGTLATAESLDRPTELKFSNRQELWQSIIYDIIWFVIEQAVVAPLGVLSHLGHILVNEYGEKEVTFGTGVDIRVNVKFPEIISLNVKDQIASIISLATLDGKTIQNFDTRFICEQLLQSLGVDDIDEIIKAMFPDGVNPVQENVTIINAIKFLTETINKYDNRN